MTIYQLEDQRRKRDKAVLEQELKDITEPHKPQFVSAPGQARKTATVEEAMGAAAELKHKVGEARRLARERRTQLARYGKMELPPKQD
jgi:hypothetical protein